MPCATHQRTEPTAESAPMALPAPSHARAMAVAAVAPWWPIRNSRTYRRTMTVAATTITMASGTAEAPLGGEGSSPAQGTARTPTTVAATQAADQAVHRTPGHARKAL